MIYGYKEEYEQEDLDGSEYKYGALSREPLFVIPRKERYKYQPKGEVQRGRKGDMSDCATRGPINKLETDFTYAYKKKIFSEKNREWLKTNGYVDNDGNVIFSDAFNAILSGTTKDGNSMKKPLQSIYDDGLIPKDKLPFDPNMTWDEYHDPNRITQNMRDLGKAFKRRFELRFEQIDTAYLKTVNEKEEVIVAGHAWSKPVKGVYPRTEEPPNHVWKSIEPEYFAFDNYIDRTDGDFIKQLAPDYIVRPYGYRVFIVRENPDAVDDVFDLSILTRVIALLKQVLELLKKKEEIKPIIITTPETTMPSNRERLLQAAKARIGIDASPRERADDDVACAESVSEILKEVLPDFPIELSTIRLNAFFRKDIRFKITLDLKPGNIIMSPTGTGNGTVIGHVGIISENGKIMSNTSKDGVWRENFTIQTWVERWRNKGRMPIFVYELL